MRFFPRTLKTSKVRLPERQKTCRPRFRSDDPEKCFDYRKEFDLLVSKKYTEMPAGRKEKLWKLVGSYLISTIGSIENPRNRLNNALLTAHEKLP